MPDVERTKNMILSPTGKAFEVYAVSRPADLSQYPCVMIWAGSENRTKTPVSPPSNLSKVTVMDPPAGKGLSGTKLRRISVGTPA